MFPLRTTLLPALAMPARRVLIAAWVAASAFVGMNPSQGQPVQAPGASGAVPAPQYPAPVNPETLSCNALKAKLQSTGQLTILVGTRGGWGDTFYGPGVPRCQFWQMPLFTYVRANDGLCGVGYVCVEKISRD